MTLDRAVLGLTFLGSAPLLVAASLLLLWLWEPPWGRRLALVVGLSIVVNLALKGLFDLPRPFEVDPSRWRLPAALATAGGAAFPSGHAQQAATFWGLLALSLSRRRSGALLAAAGIVVLVAFSRVYLGLHSFRDVAVGSLLGLAFAGLGSRLPDPVGLGAVGRGVAAVLALAAGLALPSAARPLALVAGVVVGSVPFRPPPDRLGKLVVAAGGAVGAGGLALGLTAALGTATAGAAFLPVFLPVVLAVGPWPRWAAVRWARIGRGNPPATGTGGSAREGEVGPAGGPGRVPGSGR